MTKIKKSALAELIELWASEIEFEKLYQEKGYKHRIDVFELCMEDLTNLVENS